MVAALEAARGRKGECSENVAFYISRDAIVGYFHPKKHREHHEPFLETAGEGQWCSPGGVEHKLEFTEIYHLFLRHFEDKISG